MPGLSAPRKQVLGRHSIATRHLGHDGTWRSSFFENAGLLVRRPAAASCLSRDHLNPANWPWRLKHMVKHQLKTIQAEDRQPRSSAAAIEGGVNTPLTLKERRIRGYLPPGADARALSLILQTLKASA